MVNATFSCPLFWHISCIGVTQHPSSFISCKSNNSESPRPPLEIFIILLCVSVFVCQALGIRQNPLQSSTSSHPMHPHYRMHPQQGCARLINQRQHDSSYQPLAMDSSPQLPSGTNYTTSTTVPRSNRTHYRQNRTTAYQRHSRSWQAASRAPSSPLWRC